MTRDQYCKQHGFVPWVTTLLDNHNHDFAFGHVEMARGLGLLYRDVDAAQPGAVRAHERVEISSGINVA